MGKRIASLPDSTGLSTMRLMGSRNPVTKRPLTVIERIEELGCIDEIDELLQDGTSPADVARFIQQTLGELKDFEEDTLVRALRKRRETPPAPKPVEMYSPAEDAPPTPRAPSTLARGAYMKQSRGIDSLIELESLYLSIRDRIGWRMEQEQKPRKDAEGREYYVEADRMYLDFTAAREIVKEHAKLQTELGMSTSDRFRITLDVQGMRSKFGASIAEVLTDPEGRHKVLALLERLKSAGALPADVIDGHVASGGE